MRSNLSVRFWAFISIIMTAGCGFGLQEETYSLESSSEQVEQVNDRNLLTLSESELNFDDETSYQTFSFELASEVDLQGSSIEVVSNHESITGIVNKENLTVELSRDHGILEAPETFEIQVSISSNLGQETESVQINFEPYYCNPTRQLNRPFAGEIEIGGDTFQAICSIDQFLQISNEGQENWDHNFILKQNIENDDELLNFVPIGHFAPLGGTVNPYTKIFDGNGKILKGLTINRAGEDEKGLFGALQGAVIKNLTLLGIHVYGGDRVGLLAGTVKNSEITNVHAYAGSSNGSIVQGSSQVGGLIGSAELSCVYGSKSLAMNQVTSWGVSVRSVTTGRLVGGLIGDVTFFSGCHVKPIFTELSFDGMINNGEEIIGGLIGYSNGIEYQDVYANVTIVPASNGRVIGGLFGSVEEANIVRGYTKGLIFGKQTVGGIAGSVDLSNFKSFFTIAETHADVGLLSDRFVPSGTSIGAQSVYGWDVTDCKHLDYTPKTCTSIMDDAQVISNVSIYYWFNPSSAPMSGHSDSSFNWDFNTIWKTHDSEGDGTLDGAPILRSAPFDTTSN